MILIQTQDNVIIRIAESVEYDHRNYPYIDVNGFRECYAVPSHVVREVAEVPEEVTTEKYCYTPEDGFYIRPGYVEPNGYGIPDDLVERIKNDAITEVEEAVTNGTDE